MKIKPLILLGTLILTSFFLVGITVSDFPPEPTGTYSPWGDLNDDGIIDIYDIVWLTGRYQKTGIPVNKTALLYNVSDTLAELLSIIDILNNTVGILDHNVTELSMRMQLMNNTIAELETELAILNATKMGKPNFDSGWQYISAGQTKTFEHWLNSTDALVYMMGQQEGQSPYIHTKFFGSVHDLGWKGCYWHDLNNATVSVTRNPSDTYWDLVRVVIWKFPEP